MQLEKNVQELKELIKFYEAIGGDTLPDSYASDQLYYLRDILEIINGDEECNTKKRDLEY